MMKLTLSNVADSLMATMATDVRNWSINKNDAWIYGIICGWNNEDRTPFSYSDRPTGLNKISEDEWNRLHTLHAAFVNAVNAERFQQFIDKPSAESPRGVENMYKIQFRDLVAMHLLAAWQSDPQSGMPNEETVRNCYKVADIMCKVRNE